MRAMRLKPIKAKWSVVLMAFLWGCASHQTISTDPATNYRRVFADVPLRETLVLKSRLEITNGSFLGLFPKTSNGEWEFEFLATPEWVSAVRSRFEEIAWPEPRSSRQMPKWFSPTPEEYSVWWLDETSYPAAHLFIERTPMKKGRVHVFMCRH